jgi:hypothetical protein
VLYFISGQPARMWRNWYTRTLEVRVALPCEFESRHPHFLFISSKIMSVISNLVLEA